MVRIAYPTQQKGTIMTNINNDPFSLVHDSGECLVSVHGYFFEEHKINDMVTGIRFQFDNHVVCLVANDDDSFEVFNSFYDNAEEDITVRDIRRVSPWNYVISLPLLWIWRMINQQDYFDGFQFQFGTVDSISTIQIHLKIAAGQLKAITL